MGITWTTTTNMFHMRLLSFITVDYVENNFQKDIKCNTMLSDQLLVSIATLMLIKEHSPFEPCKNYLLFGWRWYPEHCSPSQNNSHQQCELPPQSYLCLKGQYDTTAYLQEKQYLDLQSEIHYHY